MPNIQSNICGDIHIKTIDHKSPYLSDVINLGDANSATLGFFPREAFKQYAKRENILIALDDEQIFLGYLLYRTSGRKIIIVHLCVRNEYRQQGVAAGLVTRLIRDTQDYLGIGLRCRRDYEASDVWPRLGFTARFDEEGRSKEGSTLTFWWIDHHKDDLFSQVGPNRPEEKLEIAIDANVFYDLEFEADPHSHESLALIADWIRPHVNLHLTEEIHNEIDRLNSEEEREKKRRAARNYEFVKSPVDEFKKAEESLYSFEPLLTNLSDPLDQQDESDIRHLARVIGAGFLFFVTRDETLLEVADDLYKQYGVTILRPADLITRLDQLYGEAHSQPRRLAGTRIEVQSTTQYREDMWFEHFYHHGTTERKSDFARKLRKYTSNPKRYHCRLILGAEHPLAFIVRDRNAENELRIPFLRLADVRAATTVGIHLIFQSIRLATRESRRYVLVADSHLNEELISTLRTDGFVETDRGWLKTALPIATSASEFTGVLSRIGQANEAPTGYYEEMIELIESSSTNEAQPFSVIEKQFWPAKITDAQIPTYIVPIRPEWARHLVDERLSQDDLFGAKRHLALSREGVYYRSSRESEEITAPGRILWYVSKRPKSIRACSRLEEVVVAPPKDLYRRYRRLGVYEWEHVYETADNDVSNEIMALKFSDTEHFDNPIKWDEMQSVLEGEGINTRLMTPERIPPNVFDQFYATGKKPVSQ